MKSILRFLLLIACAHVAIGADRPVGALRPGAFFWEPELSPTGPLVIVVSLPDQTLSAYRNGLRIPGGAKECAAEPTFPSGL